MGKTSNEREQLSAEIVNSLKGVSQRWQRLREIDRSASDMQFRVTLRAFNLPGGLRAADQTPLSV